MFKELSKEQLRRYYAKKAAWAKNDIKYYRNRIYEHMMLQAEGVKYKPKSTDMTYHGRKAVHCLMSIDLAQRVYFAALDELEKLYS